MTGIDISQWQSVIAPGAWDFIIARATHDGLGEDLMFDQHFANALTRAPRRGAYHFAKPIVSSGGAQAEHFAKVCLAQGFRKNVDIWALDSEANALPTQAANAAWVRDFMRVARVLLGDLCFWYVGWFYFTANFGADLALLREYPWWLPAYGPNDGLPHPPTCPYLPVLHQYTSVGGPNGSGLDVNRVLDTAGWARMFSVTPAPNPEPAPKPVPPTQVPTIDHGEDNVKTTDIKGIHLDAHGCGEVAVQGVAESQVSATQVIGGSDPLKVKRYDKTPTTRLVAGSNPALVVIEYGEPAGTYTVRVSHS